MNLDFSANIDRFSGFADQYDKYRPMPPTVLAKVLCQLAQTPRPQLVVDLGSGTGLSTRYWADKAEQVIGVEPTLDMRKQAEGQTEAANVTYRAGFSHQTGLHHTETGNAGRLVGLPFSQGSVMSLLKKGLSERELGIDVFRKAAQRVLGDTPQRWYWNSRLRFGIV